MITYYLRSRKTLINLRSTRISSTQQYLSSQMVSEIV
ncbi:hypothetical protein VP150E351_P0170 [Vibrio phage 150E35-1]|nr:hypothetical protein VP150E351_P0170 [Vibrio phage 150E35-1]